MCASCAKKKIISKTPYEKNHTYDYFLIFSYKSHSTCVPLAQKKKSYVKKPCEKSYTWFFFLAQEKKPLNVPKKRFVRLRGKNKLRDRDAKEKKISKRKFSQPRENEHLENERNCWFFFFCSLLLLHCFLVFFCTGFTRNRALTTPEDERNCWFFFLCFAPLCCKKNCTGFTRNRALTMPGGWAVGQGHFPARKSCDDTHTHTHTGW